jgi:hypothetical protein
MNRYGMICCSMVLGNITALEEQRIKFCNTHYFCLYILSIRVSRITSVFRKIPEDCNCNACRIVGKPSTFFVPFFRKRNLYAEIKFLAIVCYTKITFLLNTFYWNMGVTYIVSVFMTLVQI